VLVRFVGLVRVGAVFEAGKLVKQPDESRPTRGSPKRSSSTGLGYCSAGRNPASITVTSRRTAALDGRLLAAVRVWRQ
jgi:hypothetical protein